MMPPSSSKLRKLPNLYPLLGLSSSSLPFFFLPHCQWHNINVHLCRNKNDLLWWHSKVLFTTLNDMISVLMSSMADNSFPAKLRTFIQPSLLIVDEVGYLPVPKEGANFLFHVVSKRYEIGSIILTSNKSFSHWGEVLGDNVIASAILDQLLHHSTVFNIRGDSYRLREKKELTKDMGSNSFGKAEKEPD
jgi:DNA replication protein DnaC